MMQKANSVSNHARIRRFIFKLGIFTLILYIFSKAYPYYIENYSNPVSNEIILPYNEFIDQSGQFLPYSGYKIIQVAKIPITSSFGLLKSYLDRQDQLNSYFKFVPAEAYFLTLTNLKNKTTLNDSQLIMLKQEQELIDKNLITAIGFSEQLTIIDKHEIRLEVVIRDDIYLNAIKTYQKSWNEKFPDLIIQHYPTTSFYIVMAYQYKPIPSKDVYDELDLILKSSESFPIEIPFDPIEICSYKDMITPSAVLSDEIKH